MGPLVCRHAPLDQRQPTSKCQIMPLRSSDSLGMCLSAVLLVMLETELPVYSWTNRKHKPQAILFTEDLRCSNALRDLCAGRMAILKALHQPSFPSLADVTRNSSRTPVPINTETVGNGCNDFWI